MGILCKKYETSIVWYVFLLLDYHGEGREAFPGVDFNCYNSLYVVYVYFVHVFILLS